MKISVHGFYQPQAVELGLNHDDLLVLRWFVDCIGTGRMPAVNLDGEDFYLVDFSVMLADLPVLNITQQTLRRSRFRNLCRSGILTRATVNGTLTFFACGVNYGSLVGGVK